jgi:hypothetical protein
MVHSVPNGEEYNYDGRMSNGRNTVMMVIKE